MIQVLAQASVLATALLAATLLGNLSSEAEAGPQARDGAAEGF